MNIVINFNKTVVLALFFISIFYMPVVGHADSSNKLVQSSVSQSLTGQPDIIVGSESAKRDTSQYLVHKIRIIRTGSCTAQVFSIKNGKNVYYTEKLQKLVPINSSDNHQPWYRTQYAQVKISGKLTRIYHVTNTSQTKSFWIQSKDLQPINSTSFHPKGQHTTPYKGNIAFLGDSIPAGWDGYRLNHGNSYVDWFAQYVNMPRTHMHNYSVPDGKIVGNRYYTFHNGSRHGQDLQAQILQHRAQLKRMNYIYIAMGTNDYNYGSGSGNLAHISTTLNRYVKYIKKLNPNAHIVGILPLTRFMQHSAGDCSQIQNVQGFTLGQERAALRKVYQTNHVRVINFHVLAPNLITESNRHTSLNDGYLHPSLRTDQELGFTLSKTFKG